MSIDTTLLPGTVCGKDITTLIASGSLTITSAVAYRYGSDMVVKITYSDATVTYIKWKQGRLKIGGDSNTFSTGTEVVWEA